MRTLKAIQPADYAATEGERPRTQSGVSYPYFDLDASIKVAEAIHARGGGSCSPDQLAAWLEYKSVKSGTYLTRVAAARNFGLVQSSGRLHLSVTDRGMSIIAPVMPDDALAAKVDAFLSVELFGKVYEQFRGKQLPPEIGLKNLFKAAPYFILPDRVGTATRSFLNSAEQAGFFTTSGDRSRLIKPSTSPPAALPPEPKQDQAPKVPEKPKPSSGSGDGTGGVHTAIVGLLRELPAPGTVWSAPKKQRFLDAFKATIDFIYPEDST